MKIYTEKEITSVQKVLEKVVCDKCEKEIPKGEVYYEVTTSHLDWGNDSADSYEEQHICSDDCLQKIFTEYLENDSNSKRIDIEKRN